MTPRAAAFLLAALAFCAAPGGLAAQDAPPVGDAGVVLEAVPGPDFLAAEVAGTDLRWLCLVPPVVAIVLAVLLREVITALVAGLFGGAVVLACRGVIAPAAGVDPEPAWAVPLAGFTSMLDDFVVPQAAEIYHVQTVLFTLLLGATVGVMSRSGGTKGLVEAVAGGATTRTRAQGTVWGLGFLVFFDDYSNTLLLGGTTRPLTDRLKVSREKLAFIIDSTAAPIAGLALISTWVGVEMSYISEGFEKIGAGPAGYDVFLATVPYRFYPIYLLAFVAAVAFTGRDFGPMLAAERRAASGGGVLKPDTEAATSAEMPEESTAPPRALNAVVPLVVLIGLLSWLMWQTGEAKVANLSAGELAALPGGAVPADTWGYIQTVIAKADSFVALLYAAAAASVAAVATALLTRSLNLAGAIDAWIAGARGMFTAEIILLLAWSISAVCGELETGDYLGHLVGGAIPAEWLPAVGFVLAGAVAFAVGSSWGTMGILLPILIPLAWNLIGEGVTGVPETFAAASGSAVMLGTIGAVLAGAIWGDHCSPISDTTVLSSASAQCGHLDHVATQFPYAVAVGAIAVLLGYVPAGYGVPWWALLPVGIGATVLLVRFAGRRVDDGWGRGEA